MFECVLLVLKGASPFVALEGRPKTDIPPGQVSYDHEDSIISLAVSTQEWVLGNANPAVV